MYFNNVNLIDQNKTLTKKANMINRKYDFTLCYNKGYIYLLCGKNEADEIVNTCERYSIKHDKWK